MFFFRWLVYSIFAITHPENPGYPDSDKIISKIPTNNHPTTS
jgi:hypothetical protein